MKTGRFTTLVAVLAAAFIAIALPIGAQQSADIIRGRVIGPDSQPIVNAAVMATSLMGGISKTTKTDKNGRFSIVYANGEGDYWISVAAIGFTQKRFEVKRLAEEEILIADAKLGPAMLERVEVVAQGQRQTATRADNTADVSGTDRGVGNASVSAADAGNMAALAASLPGFQLIPGLDGNPDLFSALGLSPDQNNSTLNGAPGSGADLPRDAFVSTGVSSSNWDVSSGGFSGAQIRVTTRTGTNYRTRNLSTQGTTPHLQWTDDVGDAVSATNTRLSVGGSLGGPLTFNKNFYSGSYQYDRTLRGIQNLFNTDPLGLQTGGVAPDSAARLRNVLQGLSIPISAGGIPGDQTVDQLRLQGAFDFTPKSPTSGSAFQVGTVVNWSHTGGATSQTLLATPTMNGERSSLNAQVTARHTNFLWDKVAIATYLSASMTSSSDDAYLLFPTGSVRVSSELDDGSTTVRSLSFGGSSSQTQHSSTALFGLRNESRWVSLNNKHTLKLTTEIRQDNVSSDAQNNRLGSFSFQSLEDLEAGRPSSYTRQLMPIKRDASQLGASMAFGDAWRPTTTFQMQYGVRMDVNRFLDTPDLNPAVKQTFGVSNDYVPNRVYLSPRAGFAWTYGTSAQIPFATGFVPGPRAVLRAGVGLFQNMSGPGLISSALSSTGLPGSSLTLICTGPAAPVPDWTGYRSNPSGAPTECADGTSPFATSLPSVTMFDPSYVQSRSVRSNANWRGAVIGNRFMGSIDATYSVAFNQPGTVDVNFDPTQRFTLENEGARPVYVNPTSIDPRFGSIASRDSRVSQSFNRVSSMRSDLSSKATQVSIGLSPLNYNPTRFTWNAGYTLQYIRDQYRGFSSTVANPLDKAWGVSSGPRHSINYGLSYNFWDYVRVSWYGGFTSGTRFTPMVSGDVNGDNTGFNDRAYIFDPAFASDAAVASGMQALMANGSASARDCLSRQLGKLASRNSCVGPWITQASNLTFSIQPIKLKLPPRANISFSINNPLAALDLMLHGSDKTRGWGQSRSPDQSLLFVRGFDPVTQRYVYEVNQRFGATSAQQTVNRSPVILTASVSFDIGPTRDWQGLHMQLDRGRTQPGVKASEAQLKSYVTNSVINPMARILQSADQVTLTRKQADSLAQLSRGFTLVLDSIWSPVAKYLGGLDTTYRESDAQERFVRAREAAANYLIKVAPSVKKLLTSSQWRRLSTGITNYLEPRYLERVRAGLVSSGIEGIFIR